MTRIIMSGCNGAMGKMITDLVAKDEEAQIVAGIDIADDGRNDYPIFSSILDCDVEADALIDFSTTKILDDLLSYCEEKGLPAVLCTTGYDRRGSRENSSTQSCQHVSRCQYAASSHSKGGEGVCAGGL